jgi:hypothetical protein
MIRLDVYAQKYPTGWYGNISGWGEEKEGQPVANDWIMFIDQDGVCFFYRRNVDGSVIEESKQVFDPRDMLSVSKPN